MNEQEQIQMLKRDRIILIVALLLSLTFGIIETIGYERARRQTDFWMNKALTIDARGK